jgi:hypothetical protein
MRDVMRFEAAGEGQRIGAKESTFSRVRVERRERNSGFVEGVGCEAVGGKRCSGPTEETKATTWVL